MSVVALTTRPARSGRPDRAVPPRPRTAPTVTITLDLGSGPLTPGLARLAELLDELAASGEAVVGPDEHRGPRNVLDQRPPAPPPPPQPHAHVDFVHPSRVFSRLLFGAVHHGPHGVRRSGRRAAVQV
ncbi:hypothetical protein ACFWDB_30790, partial [Micromonospora chalcea]